MAYQLTYWEKMRKGHFESLKTIRLKSIMEIHPLSLPHHRPDKTDQITVDRTDKQSPYFQIIWCKTHGDNPKDCDCNE